MRAIISFLIGVGLLCLAACNRQHEQPRDIAFVATIAPVEAILREIVGSRAPIRRLLPPGASPHTYEPKPSDAQAASQATALVWVAPNIDGWAAQLPATRKIAMMDHVPAAARVTAGHDHHHHHGEHGHDHSHGHDDADGHFWTSPRTVRAMLPGFLGAIIAADPAGERAYRANAAEFDKRLAALETEIAATLAPINGRKAVLFHPSFLYLLRDFGLEYAGSIEPAPGKEASAAWLKEVVDLLQREKIGAVFAEPQLSRRPAEVVAEAAAIKLLELDPNGGIPGREAYDELIRYNAQQLLEGLR